MKNQIYSNARCKALESKLVTKNQIMSIIDEYDVDKALKAIKEYGIGYSDVANPLEFETLLSEETYKLFKLLDEIDIADDIKDYIMLPQDFTNAEILYKSRVTGDLSLIDYIRSDGKINSNVLKKAIMNRDYTSLPTSISSVLNELDKSTSLSGKEISVAFKKGFYQNVKLKDKDLIGIHKTKIDLINTEMCFRAKSHEDFYSQMLGGGTLDSNVFDIILSKDEKKITDNLKTCYIYDEIRYIIETGDLTRIEKCIDDTPLNILNKFKYEIRDNVPTLRYIFMFLSQIRNIRIAFVGILNKLPKETIKQRLRWQYER